MADEKIIIAEIDIDVDASIKDTIRLKEEVKRLKDETELLKGTTGETSAEYIKSNAALKSTQAELRSQETITQKVITANDANTGSLDQLKARLAVVSKQWSALSEEQRLNSDAGKKLASQKLELTKALGKEEIATGDSRRGIGEYERGIGQANQTIGTLIPGIGGASTAMKTFGMVFNLALLPITAIIAAIAALVTYFKRTEEGQDNLTKIMKIFGVVLNNLMDIVGNIGEALYKAVMEPKKAWQSFKDFVAGIGQFFKDTFGNVIGGSVEIFVAFMEKGFANVGLAWQKFKDVFIDNSDKVEKAQEKIEEANKKIEDGQERINKGAQNLKDGFVNAYDRIKDKIGEFVGETKREIEIAKYLADLQASIDKRTRENLVLEAKERLSLAKIRNDIDAKDENSAEKRLKLIEEYNTILDKQSKRLLQLAKDRLTVKEEGNKLSQSNKEDLQEEAQLRAELYNVEAQIDAQRKESIQKRIEAQREAAQESVKLLEYELASYLEINKEKLQDFEEQFELQKNIIDEQLETGIIKQNDYNLKLLQLDNEYRELQRAQKLEAAQIDYENDLTLAEENMFAQLDLERKGLEVKKKQEIEYAKKIGADVNKIEQKYAKASKEIDKAEKIAKLNIAQDFAGNIATIAGEGTAVGKAAAVASTTIATYMSATQAFSAMVGIPIVGPILGAVAAAAAVASGIINVKKILSVKSGLPGDGGGGGGGGSVSAAIPATVAPEATIRSTVNPEVGAGIVSRSIQDQNNSNVILQPTLVEDEVTSKQKNTTSMQNTSVL